MNKVMKIILELRVECCMLILGPSILGDIQ